MSKLTLFYFLGFAAIIAGAWLLARRFGQRSVSNQDVQQRVIPRDQHNISRKQITPNALKVLYRLQDAGFQAYIVGGGVRDLLLGLRPKDFDVATDALPEQVHKLFRNSRLIGRRFKLVHVHFGREIIEVATFRGHHDDADEGQSAQSEQGMLLRDNVYGTLEQDMERRDFTVNALYYSAKDFCIYDNHGGMHDLQHKRLRIIGDAEARYREDPVRMLRAVRFAAKLGFQLEQSTAAPIRQLAPLLGSISNARLFDEAIKLLSGGQGFATWQLMAQYDLIAPLFPATWKALQAPTEQAQRYQRLIEQALRNTDERIAQDKPVTPAFMYAVLLWPVLEQHYQAKLDEGWHPIPAMHEAAQQTLDAQVKHISIPRRISAVIKEIWELQWRLPRRQGRRAQQLMEHPRFRAGFDFVLLREQSGEDLEQLGQWWQAYQDADEEGREQLVRELGQSPAPNKSKRRRRPRQREQS
ncbi:polynucleotide adenylyltransferase PcnB [Balneatrix alpica]|uniref:Poly(A) polymerase I n=1 Tax=Balneatrix alpica TaxID=75684 RepID=A0ABV5ZCV1_9GAMM|nr:polynucleotide adenylyltransferase PcnB [Balneatrix alpica]